jgi:hypothetical protein
MERITGKSRVFQRLTVTVNRSKERESRFDECIVELNDSTANIKPYDLQMVLVNIEINFQHDSNNSLEIIAFPMDLSRKA